MLASSHGEDTFAFERIKPLAEVELEYIQYVLDKCGGNKQKAASLLGINRKTIHRKLGMA
jgi:DNA-binding protein Fis